MASVVDGLNMAQRRAATFGEGPLLVIAGAGTGKTRTLACRVAHLIERGTPPQRILLLTFTRRAAAEMIARAGRLTGTHQAGKTWSGTFHAVANRLLRIYAPAIGLAPEFTVMDQGDAADTMNLVRNELGVARGKKRFPKKQTLLSIYSHTVNAQTPLVEVLERHFPWCNAAVDGIAQVFDGYMARKAKHNVLDFDDLLLYWQALAESAEAGDSAGGRFDHILVDEYQDTNAIQSAILRGMRRRYKSIMAVGDDAQSIYSFRAATVRNMLDFPKHFPGTEMITLEENYRSTQPILAASNAVMEQASERYTKKLHSSRESAEKPVLLTCLDESQQCDAVCENILNYRETGMALLEQAVLFRAGHHSAALEIELARRNIPFHKYGGLKFVEAAHIKDMLAFLRVLENPRDVMSWFRLLQLPAGIGPKGASRVLDAIGVHESANDPEATARESRMTPLQRLVAKPPIVAPAAREDFERIRLGLADCAGATVHANGADGIDENELPDLLPVAAQLERLRECYQPIFERIYDNAAVRLRDLEQLEQIASGYSSRRRFVTDMTLDPPVSTGDLAGPPMLDEDYLILSTIHSAKGCEWKAVHIIHAADGMIPSDMATGDSASIDEERRLLYVAMTRAKDHLHVYFPLRYYHRKHHRGDAHSYAQVSRFLTPEARTLMDERGGGRVDDDAAELTATLDPRAIRARLSDLWRT